MKNKLFRSVRIEIVTYVIISLILSLITTLIITSGLFMLRELLKRDTTTYSASVENINSVLNGETKNAVNKQPAGNSILRYRDEARIRLIENSRFAWFIILEVIACFIFFFAVYFIFLNFLT